jgi:hypothetical protein
MKVISAFCNYRIKYGQYVEITDVNSVAKYDKNEIDVNCVLHANVNIVAQSMYLQFKSWLEGLLKRAK